MKKLLISAVLALMLVAVIAVPAVADVSQDVNASVTVTEYSSVTITANPITFGSVDPGTVKSAATNNPAVTIAAGEENNQDIAVQISGTDFAGDPSGTITIGNAFWHTSNTPGDATAMSTSAAPVATLSAGQYISVYHWLTVPDETSAATYTSTFTYHTNATDEEP
jgi:hypothetical protein